VHVQTHARNPVTIVGDIEKAPDIATLGQGLKKSKNSWRWRERKSSSGGIFFFEYPTVCSWQEATKEESQRKGQQKPVVLFFPLFLFFLLFYEPTQGSEPTKQS
jgi:hypothetical protein